MIPRSQLVTSCHRANSPINPHHGPRLQPPRRVWANLIAAWFLAGGGWDENILWACLAGTLFYVAGMIQNDVYDADWDIENNKDRPIAQGKIGRRLASFLTFPLFAGGIFTFLWLDVPRQWLLTLFAAIIAYNLFHKKWAGSMWIMGACRFMLFIVGASILQEMPGTAVWIWAGALLFYVAGVTFAARGENTGGSVKAASKWLLGVPAVAGIGVGIWQAEQYLWVSLAFVGIFVAWLIFSYRRLKSSEGNIGIFVSSLLAGMVLVDAMAASSVNPWASAVCLSLLPLNLVLQRFIPAT